MRILLLLFILFSTFSAAMEERNVHNIPDEFWCSTKSLKEVSREVEAQIFKDDYLQAMSLLRERIFLANDRLYLALRGKMHRVPESLEKIFIEDMENMKDKSILCKAVCMVAGIPEECKFIAQCVLETGLMCSGGLAIATGSAAQKACGCNE
ncbi:hypothetical protein [Pseudoalteromonas luteoviolacea]|uniref:hypothetical protein n=1 Tax=Pseudoalteromonas luteoviolacea TaxID=43657 RepID=UPI001B3944FD|nr:hypothetical protein [Pseudoalteromonas luteoviolacea]MBQ4836480.1 hypothetical protein [Pseudoalteromonas luteoviolacea]